MNVEIGDVFGRLTVMDNGVVIKGRRKHLVRCLCGQERRVPGYNLRNGNTTSCGCWARESAAINATSHGMRWHPLYSTWEGMMARCHRKTAAGYHDYGGRGIFVCQRWHDPRKFFEDMGPKPDKNLELNRIDNEAGYEPGNVEWATKKRNMRNRRCSVLIGDENIHLIDASEEKGFHPETIRHRIKRGDVDIFRPLKKGERYAMKKSRVFGPEIVKDMP